MENKEKQKEERGAGCFCGYKTPQMMTYLKARSKAKMMIRLFVFVFVCVYVCACLLCQNKKCVYLHMYCTCMNVWRK